MALYKVGDDYDGERVEELTKKGYLAVEMTVKELKKELDDRGIAYDTKDRKPDLLKLLGKE